MYMILYYKMTVIFYYSSNKEFILISKINCNRIVHVPIEEERRLEKFKIELF